MEKKHWQKEWRQTGQKSSKLQTLRTQEKHFFLFSKWNDASWRTATFFFNWRVFNVEWAKSVKKYIAISAKTRCVKFRKVLEFLLDLQSILNSPCFSTNCHRFFILRSFYIKNLQLKKNQWSCPPRGVIQKKMVRMTTWQTAAESLKCRKRNISTKTQS